MSEVKTRSSQFREHWLNLRRKRFWLIIFILLYTLAGFFLAPVVIKKTVIGLFQDDLGRSAQIEQVKVNPYVLSLDMRGFQVTDKDGIKLMAFDHFFANYQLSSLFKWAFVFKEVRLEAPYFHVERFKTGATRMENLLADLAAVFPPDPDESSTDQDSSAPRLLIKSLRIINGRVIVTDNVPANVVELDLTPINVHVQALNTLPDVVGQQSVEIMLPNDGRLTWSGNLKLAPFHSEGQLTLKNLRFDRLVAYLKPILPLQAVDGLLSSQFKYRMALDDQLDFTLKVDELQTDVDELVVKGLSPAAEFVNIPKISLTGGKLSYPEQSLTFENMQIQQPVLSVWRNPDGTISLLDLMAGSGSSATVDNAKSTATVDDSSSPTTVADSGNSETEEDAGTSAFVAETSNSKPVASSAPAGLPWSLLIEQLIVDGGQLNVNDNSADPGVALNLTDLNIKMAGLSNADGASMPLELTGNLQQGGSYTLNADLVVLPELSLTASMTTTQIPLTLAQTYAKAFAHIEILAGAVDSNLKIELPDPDTVSVSGSLQVTALDVNDTIVEQKLLGWNKLVIDQFEFTQDKLRLSQLVFEEPFGRFKINQDRSTNVSALMIVPAGSAQPDSAETDGSPDKPAPAEGASETGTPATANAPNDGAKAGQNDPLTLIVGGVVVKNGSMEFADMSLPLPFSTNIGNLNGTISTIATDSSTPANIKLEGQVDEFGLARIGGSLNMFDPIKHADVKVEFRNLMMSALSPYTVEFAGREIDEGKLDLDLEYKIAEGILDGENDIVLSDLVLGKKVDHPGAASLPLGLAVALLKDSKGVIQVDLPVHGDINDPEFKIGGVIWKAIGSLITKIVTAPFKWLGNLIGSDSEDLGQFEFLAGRSDLTPPELEKVAQLQQALQERPALSVEISGVTDSAVDAPALKEIRLRQIASERLGEGLAGKDQQSLMLDERIRNLVEEMFKERFPDVSTDELQDKYKAPPEDDPEGVAKLDELAYATDLWQQLLAAEIITDEDLENLANERAEVIRNAFLASGEFDEKRLVIAASKQVTSEDGEWVVMELGVAAD